MSQAKILIVEDEGIVQMDIHQRLLTLGYDVVGGAATGADAISKASQLLPDLVLMDIQLKGKMDGIQAADEIRKNLDLPNNAIAFRRRLMVNLVHDDRSFS